MTLSELKNLIDELYKKGAMEFADYNIGIYLDPGSSSFPSTIDIKVANQEIFINDKN